jgi:hypothetical protein
VRSESTVPDRTGRRWMAAAAVVAGMAAAPLLPAQPAAAKAPRTAVLQPQEPIVLRGKKDHVIQGVRIVPGDGKAAAGIALYDCENITISCCEIGPVEKHAIYAGGCRGLKIVNCWFHDAKGNGLEAYQCTDVLVQGNRMERISTGVYALQSTRVQVVGNYVEDVQGPMPRGQLAQFNNVKGEGNVVSQDYGVNFADKSRPEDLISLFQSEGTEKSPILIEKNEWDAWKYFKSNGLPKPPSARPTPPVLYGDALVPWKLDAKKSW